MSVATVAVHIPSETRQIWWIDTLSGLLPDWQIVSSRETVNADRIDYAVVWKPPDNYLIGLPNLRAVVSIGAGVDHILVGKRYPESVPLIKTIGDDLTQRMCEYIALQALRLHRQLPYYDNCQKLKKWQQKRVPTASDCNVGILGAGVLGQAAGRTLGALGFSVRLWSRSARTLPGLNVYAGRESLSGFLKGCQIIVCLLPLTAETDGILDHALMMQLPRGAALINAARGHHLDETALLDCLNDEQLSYAVLDVFRQEPLPENHPFWNHPRVLITPHIASLVDPETGGKIIARNLQDFHAGKPVPHMADPERGY